MKVGIVYSKGDFKKAFPNDYEGRNNIIDDVENAFKKLKIDFKKIPANKTIFSELEKEKFDLIFNAADEGFEMNPVLEPHIPAILETFNVPYTGSNYLTLGTCLDKVKTKQIMKSYNLPTPEFMVFNKKIKKINTKKLKFPLIVKPAKEDGSIGIKINSVVNTKKELLTKINEVIEKYNQPALVEEFIDGREIYVGILGRDELEILPLTEIKFTLPKGYANFLPYEAKWDKKSEYYKNTTPICPAKIEKKLENKIKDYAKKAYEIFELKDYGRIDFRINKKNQIFILEINPNPDLSNGTGIAKMAMMKNITYERLIKKIISFQNKKGRKI